MPLPLGRRVKARAVESESEDDYDIPEGSSPSVLDTAEDHDVDIASDKEDDDEEQGAGGQANEEKVLANISFGTLRKAQDSLSKKRKRGSDEAPRNEDKLEALRARLRELREAKGLEEAKDVSKKKSKKTKSKHDEDGDEESEDGDGSESESESDSDDQGPPKSRSSKHAPGSQSSKRQVTRKRTVVDAPKKHIRDPRFGPIGGRTDETKLQQNYAFLNDYAETEMAELKTAIKKSKDEDDKEVLKRKLLSMESRKKAREAKEREQEVLREHRKKEKDAIKEGKNPFYLKRKDQKQLALVEKYNSMKSKDREKLMERRRKKVDGREKKRMPQARRMQA